MSGCQGEKRYINGGEGGVWFELADWLSLSSISLQGPSRINCQVKKKRNRKEKQGTNKSLSANGSHFLKFDLIHSPLHFSPHIALLLLPPSALVDFVLSLIEHSNCMYHSRLIDAQLFLTISSAFSVRHTHLSPHILFFVHTTNQQCSPSQRPWPSSHLPYWSLHEQLPTLAASTITLSLLAWLHLNLPQSQSLMRLE